MYPDYTPRATGESPQEYFRIILLTVVGGAFNAAGYTLEESPTAWRGGLFRFHKPLDTGIYAGMDSFIEWQYLYYIERQPARIRVNLMRVPGLGGAGVRVSRELSALVVDDFDVGILPGGGYWWSFQERDVTAMGKAIAEAGSLAIGYGMGWLAGDLMP